MPTSYLHSERHFRLYEKYLKAIVDSWPIVSIFTPQPPVASVETLSSRIRICKEALQRNIQGAEPLWKTDIKTDRFLLVCDEITVSTTAIPGKVVCGPMDAVRAQGVPVGVPCEPIVEQVIPKVNLDNPTGELLTAILTLHHYRLLSDPSIIKLVQGSPFHAQIAEFAATHDIAVSRNDNTYTIL